MELFERNACDLSEIIKNKEISSAELTKSVFDRIKAVEGKVDAYLTLDEENAMKKAAEIDEKLAKGEELSPLAGIPVGIKDNISTKGLRTTCASKMLGNYVPPFNATVMNKLDDIVVTGKLNMDEFAMGSSTENSHFKPTKNPFDTERIPGGSSGGSAAAVAAGLAPVALGTDTGGSIRQPAAFCGVTGIKPTYSRVSRFGLVAFASSLDQIGSIGLDAHDCAILLNEICGYDFHDGTSSKLEVPDFTAKIGESMKGMKIALPKEFYAEGINDEVKAAVLKAAEEYKAMGAELIECSMPSLKYAVPCYYLLACAEAASNLSRYDGIKYGHRTLTADSYEELIIKSRSEGFGDEVKRRIMLGTFVLSSGFYDAYYKKAKLVQKRIMQEFASQFADVDVIATPTVPSTAFKIGENTDDPLKMYANDVCTVTVNIAGLPAISIPCAYDDKGLPVGMQLIGGKFTEQRLLNTAYAYEQLVGGFKMPEL